MVIISSELTESDLLAPLLYLRDFLQSYKLGMIVNVVRIWIQMDNIDLFPEYGSAFFWSSELSGKLYLLEGNSMSHAADMVKPFV